MESDIPAAGGPSDRGPSDARQALDALAVDRAALADRLRNPWWYYPALGAIVAAFVASPAVSDTNTRSTLITFGCVALVFLMLALKKVVGFTVSRHAGPRSRATQMLLGVVLAALLVASIVANALGYPVYVVVAAAAAFLGMVIGGRWYDRVYDSELRDGR